jgi:hypothetical protein
VQGLAVTVEKPCVPRTHLCFSTENGKTLCVIQNLYDAMITLHAIMGEDMTSPLHVVDFFQDQGLTKSGHIWIDALCINHEDKLERTNQVALMAELYKRENSTFGWLGKADAYAEVALEVFAKLLALLHDDPAFEENFHGSIHNLQDHGLFEKHWTAVFAFFQRLWFRRAWVS